MTHDAFWVVCFWFYFCFGRSGWGNVLIRESLERTRFLKINPPWSPGVGISHRFSGLLVLSWECWSVFVSCFGVTTSEACSRSYGSAAKLFSKGKVCVMVSEQWGPGTGNIILSKALFCAAAAAAAKSLQPCPTLCDPIDGSPPGSPVPRILQARILEWVAISFSNAWKWSHSVVSDSSRPHGLQPTQLLHPWEFPGKNTGVGCHRLFHLLCCMNESC